MSQLGQSLGFDDAPITSGLPPLNRHRQHRSACRKGATFALMHRRSETTLMVGFVYRSGFPCTLGVLVIEEILRWRSSNRS
jgi:hypothetical protein